MIEKNSGISQETVVSTIAVKEEINKPRKLPQYIAGLSATIGALATGFALGWSSPAGDNGSNLKYSFDINPDDFSWISSMFNLGAAASCILIGMLTDLLGRRMAMLILVIPFTIGWACVLWPNSVTTLIIGRFLLGVSGGAFCVTLPIYTAETADRQTRGRLGSYLEMAQCAGILCVYLLGLLNNMFLLSLVSAIVPLVFFVTFFFMPETPTYHLMNGREDAARSSLLWFRGPNYDVDAEMKEQIDALEEAKRNKVSFFVAIRSKVAVKGLFIAYGLMLYQQLSGINAIVFYGSSMFAGDNGVDSKWSIILVASFQVITVFVSTMLIDNWGRRIILLISATIMCLTTLVLGVYFYLQHTGNSMTGLTWVPLVCICGFVVSMEFGFGPIPWMMMGEIFSPTIRSIAGSSACFLNWTMAFVVTKFYNDLTEATGVYGAFWIFSGICGSAIVFVVLFVPETKGKSLEQIQVEMSGKSRSKNKNQE